MGVVDMKLPVEDYLDQRIGLEYYIWARDNLFRDPTLENAIVFLRPGPPNGWSDPSVPLAAVHKARLQWLDATDNMLRESREWLQEHGYSLDFRELLPLTPESRDRERVAQGKKPLTGEI